MIYDLFAQAACYRGVLPAMGDVLHALSLLDLASRPTGRETLLPDRADLIIDRYTPSQDRPVVWETHRQFADLQLMVVGEERFGWLPASAGPPVKTPYDPERDVCFYQAPEVGHSPAPSYLALTPGTFALFLPGDLHAPGLCPMAGTPQPVTKAVVKIRLDA
ncbi:YhcH/YjgK/YiaL family protein [Phycisphaeraceae bacterium D3-23]